MASLHRRRRQDPGKIAGDPAGWKKAAHDKAFTDTYTPSGDSLVRVPKGIAPDHPFADDIRRKDFIAGVNLTQKEVTADSFLDDYTALCRLAAPYMRFLCEAIGVGF